MDTKNDTLTAEQVRKIRSAIADCDRYIAKEGARTADLRPREVQECLDGYIAHRAKLQDALATGVFPSVKG